jgi:hypothetical protein
MLLQLCSVGYKCRLCQSTQAYKGCTAPRWYLTLSSTPITPTAICVGHTRWQHCLPGQTMVSQVADPAYLLQQLAYSPINVHWCRT